METAPITIAHAHARTAFSQGQTSNIRSAIEEHALAAEEFAHAAESTKDAEVCPLSTASARCL